jgi:hypothetical protein
MTPTPPSEPPEELPPARGRGIEWATRIKCPSCGASGSSSWVADDYGQTCTNCGFNYGYGEGERQNFCNHMWRAPPTFSDIPDNVVICIYCKAQEEIEEE